MSGFSLRIFLPDGSPDGLRLVEKSNWSGHGIVCPRPLFPTARNRPEFSRTGVYVLLGPPAEGELPKVYIGEGDPIRPRLENHQANKEFWTTAICFTGKDGNLNKAHFQHLESRLLELAREAKRCTLDNVNAPQLPSLSEADIADMETFLDEMLLCFPVLGVTIFERLPDQSLRSAPLLSLNIAGVTAQGYESADGFIVCAGSEVRESEMASMPNYARGLKAALCDNGVIVSENKKLRFSQDYEFASPSAAASIVVGASANGRTAWKNADGLTLKQVQEAVVQ